MPDDWLPFTDFMRERQKESIFEKLVNDCGRTRIESPARLFEHGVKQVHQTLQRSQLKTGLSVKHVPDLDGVRGLAILLERDDCNATARFPAPVPEVT